MSVTIKQNSRKETVITVTGPMDPATIQRVADYLRYLELTRGMKNVPQAEVDALATEVKRGMALKRRKRMAS